MIFKGKKKKEREKTYNGNTIVWGRNVNYFQMEPFFFRAIDMHVFRLLSTQL